MKPTPKYTQTQLEKVSPCCRTFRLKHFGNQKVIAIGDEKYFIFRSTTLVGNSGLHTNDFEVSPGKVKYKYVAVGLIWCTISETGISEPVIGKVILFLHSVKPFSIWSLI